MADRNFDRRLFLKAAGAIGLSAAWNPDMVLAHSCQPASSRLYFSERGRVPFRPNEEIWQWAWIRKTFEIAPSKQDGVLFLFVKEYPDNTYPLNIQIGDLSLQLKPQPEIQGVFAWREVKVPATMLSGKQVVFTVTCQANSMNAWILALDVTGNKGISVKSVDQGKTWQSRGMGFDNSVSGEYVMRLRAEGPELRHPDLPFQYEDPNNAKLTWLRSYLKEQMGSLPDGGDLEKSLALNDWLTQQWPHRYDGPGSIYAPWDATTILAWGRRQDKEKRSIYCVHYAVAFVQFATAIGLESRVVVSDVTHPTAGDGHCIPEVYCRDLKKWVMLDPDTDLTFMADGNYLSVLEFHELTVSGRHDQVQFVPRKHHHEKPEVIRNFWKDYWPGALFKRWGILLRNDFYSQPEHIPLELGEKNHHCVDLLWYDSPAVPRYDWFPYHSSKQEDFLIHRSGKK